MLRLTSLEPGGAGGGVEIEIEHSTFYYPLSTYVRVEHRKCLRFGRTPREWLAQQST